MRATLGSKGLCQLEEIVPIGRHDTPTLAGCLLEMLFVRPAASAQIQGGLDLNAQFTGDTRNFSREVLVQQVTHRLLAVVRDDRRVITQTFAT